MENQLKDFYYELKPGQNIGHVYYLSNIVRFENESRTLKKRYLHFTNKLRQKPIKHSIIYRFVSTREQLSL